MGDRVISYLNREKENKFIVNQPKKYGSILIIRNIKWIYKEIVKKRVNSLRIEFKGNRQRELSVNSRRRNLNRIYRKNSEFKVNSREKEWIQSEFLRKIVNSKWICEEYRKFIVNSRNSMSIISDFTKKIVNHCWIRQKDSELKVTSRKA